jgi:hypothetical protein
MQQCMVIIIVASDVVLRTSLKELPLFVAKTGTARAKRGGHGQARQGSIGALEAYQARQPQQKKFEAKQNLFENILSYNLTRVICTSQFVVETNMHATTRFAHHIKTGRCGEWRAEPCQSPVNVPHG